MSQKIIGRITNYRIGIKAQQPKECLIEFTNVNSVSLAGKLVGQKVIWVNGKKTHTGKIVGPHGRNGIVKVKFARPVPGQAIGTTVQLIG
ncbi:MAG: 50S ribosomal protein L35ae [Candidatus Bathyarchaeia archaeon]